MRDMDAETQGAKDCFWSLAAVAVRPIAVVRDFPAGVCFAVIAAAQVLRLNFRFQLDSGLPAYQGTEPQ